MALFPSSPTNGQQTTVNGILYTYNSAQTAWVRTNATFTNNDLVLTGNLTVSGDVSTANITGTLIQSTSGGFKFPDGTTQTTAATGGGGAGGITTGKSIAMAMIFGG